jgi:hypothetical protein
MARPPDCGLDAAELGSPLSPIYPERYPLMTTALFAILYGLLLTGMVWLGVALCKIGECVL